MNVKKVKYNAFYNAKSGFVGDSDWTKRNNIPKSNTTGSLSYDFLVNSGHIFYIN